MATTMRAWTYTSRGKPAAVLELRDVPRPTPDVLATNEVLVKVTCAAVFQGSAKLMELLPHFNSLPWIPEYDFSGVIEAVGVDVRDLGRGDAVFGAPNPKTLKRDERHNGVLAEYVVLDAGQVVRKSEKLSFEDACGLAGNGCTTVQFCERLELKLGDRVLVVRLSSNYTLRWLLLI
jgi:NADPH:quinone reductase-like Zn-dependent oxidoreductase